MLCLHGELLAFMGAAVAAAGEAKCTPKFLPEETVFHGPRASTWAKLEPKHAPVELSPLNAAHSAPSFGSVPQPIRRMLRPRAAAAWLGRSACAVA